MNCFLISVLVPFFLLFDGGDKDRYAIMSFSQGYESAVIDSEVKKQGDRFSSNAVVDWKDELVLHVRDTQTGKAYYLTPETINVIRKHTMRDYGSRVVNTYVNAQDEDHIADAPVYMLAYIQGGRKYEVELQKGMSLSGYPESLALFSQTKSKEEKVENNLITDDFKGFIKSLLYASQEAKAVLSLFPKEYDCCKDEDKNRMRTDYMFLIHQYTDEEYYDVDYTFDELSLFLSVTL